MSPDAPDPSDDALVAAAADGSARAFEALVRRHEGKVLRVLRLLGVRAEDRPDAAQEIFLRAFRGLKGFKRGKPFGAWIYRITVNAAHDHRGRSRSRAEEQLDPASETPDGRPGTGEAAEAADLRRRLLAGLELLSERERAVFVLHEVEGLDGREIARALGISGVTVRRHLGLARKRLRRHLGEMRPEKNADRLNAAVPAAVGRGEAGEGGSSDG